MVFWEARLKVLCYEGIFCLFLQSHESMLFNLALNWIDFKVRSPVGSLWIKIVISHVIMNWLEEVMLGLVRLLSLLRYRSKTKIHWSVLISLLIILIALVLIVTLSWAAPWDRRNPMTQLWYTSQWFFFHSWRRLSLALILCFETHTMH